MEKKRAFLKRIIALLLAVAVFAIPAAEVHGLETVEPGDIIFSRDKDELLNSLLEGTLTEIKEAILSGLVSCTDLTVYYLKRIEKYNDEFNCFITICDDAVENAKEKDRLLAEGKAEGLLFGIPMVIKDNMDYEDYPTSNGYGWDDIADDNAYVVERLLEEGAVIIGKANMSAGAQRAACSISYDVGATKNSLNSELSPGGSSGGSASAVSLNFCAAALGTDSYSSLRIPAAWNSAVSLRPTVGLISTSGICPLSYSTDVPGAITRTVEDCALVTDALTCNEYAYFENLDAAALQGAKLAVIEDLVYMYGADSEVVDAFEDAVKELKSCGAEIIEVSVPNTEAGDYEGSGSLRDTIEDLMDEYDIDAFIFLECATRCVSYTGDGDFLNNAYMISPTLKVPEITVQIGVDKGGAGIGMAICSMKYTEQLLFDLAYSYTEHFDHRAMPADVARDMTEKSFVELTEEMIHNFYSKNYYLKLYMLSDV